MATLGQKPATQHVSLQKQTITGNGGTSYTLQQSVGSALDIAVLINNTRQEPSVAYSASGTTLTMTGAVNSSDSFYVIFLGKAIATTGLPVDGVGTANINANAVTDAKIAAMAATKLTGTVASARLPTGTPVQVVANTESTYNGGASAALTRDDTVPQQSEVHICLQATITPKFANSKLLIQASIPGGHQYNSYTACCLFKDSGAAIQVMPQYFPSNGTNAAWNLTHFMDAGSTAAATFKVGLGSNSGNIYQNGDATSRKYGGASASTLVIMEIAG